MAGGVGSRFWPLSRNAKPKQFIDIMGVGRTFIQMTFDRFARFIPKENFIVVTGEYYKDIVLEQLPELTSQQVLLEPMRRNTAPCIAYATYKLKKINKDAVVVFTPADHLILNENRFEEVMLENLRYAEQHDAMVTTGITPTYPATGFGYVETESKESQIAKVSAFKEKPDYETAQKFVQSGNFYWNSGMFVCSAKTMSAALETELPKIAESFVSIADVYYSHEEQAKVNKAFEESQSISIDYGVLEKITNVYVARGDFGWSDVGTWGSLYQLSEKDSNENALGGSDTLTFDSKRCMVKELNCGKLVIIDQLEDYLIVDDKDVLMICPRNNENHIKELIEKVTEQKQQLK